MGAPDVLNTGGPPCGETATVLPNIDFQLRESIAHAAAMITSMEMTSALDFM